MTNQVDSSVGGVGIWLWSIALAFFVATVLSWLQIRSQKQTKYRRRTSHMSGKPPPRPMLVAFTVSSTNLLILEAIGADSLFLEKCGFPKQNVIK